MNDSIVFMQYPRAFSNATLGKKKKKKKKNKRKEEEEKTLHIIEKNVLRALKIDKEEEEEEGD